jgi:protein N-terminal methyltransferase
MVRSPVIQDGIDYWNTQPASLDGVLGGYGYGSLPRVDALGSRQFLLYLLPELSTVPSAIRPLSPSSRKHRIRAIDVGAGIGRVTSTVLLHLVDDVVLLEPVENFIMEAYNAGLASAEGGSAVVTPWKGIKEGTKSVTFLQGTLQSFDPSLPLTLSPSTSFIDTNCKFVGRVGYTPPPSLDIDTKVDIAWCQWCLGHLSDPDLVAFLKRCKASLRDPTRSLIVVKENLCGDAGNGRARTVFDKQDSSLTRSDKAWKKIFKDADLLLAKEQVQHGLPEGLYVVKMYALR